MPPSLANRRPSRSLRRIGWIMVLASSLLAGGMVLGQFSPQPQKPQADRAEATIQAYPLNDRTRPVFATWQQQAANRTDLRVAIDERTMQVLVHAPPAVHAQIRQQLAQRPATGGNPQLLPAAGQPNGAGAQPATGQRPEKGLTARASTVSLTLRNMPAAELHARLEKLFAKSLPITADASGEWQRFGVEASPGARVTLNVHTRTREVRIEGAPLQVAAWRSVIEALDSPPSSTGSVTQLVTTKPANQERVRRTLQVLQARASGNPQGADARIAMLQQQPGQPAQPAQPPQNDGQQIDPQTAQDAIALAEAAGALLGPVQVEFVEGLDVIIITGAERDVQRVLQIIEQIEAISEITVPAIEIYNLQHVGSVQLAVLLNRLYTEVLGTRIGTVSITPLGKPNALLLIGREENVQMAIELIQRLDQPVTPTSRFEVFPLQHASAAEAKTLIDAYLRQDEEGAPIDEEEDVDTITHTPPMSPRAIVVADIRTNFLIVRASPRDLVEIASLLARIDQPGAAAQLKVFTIRNGDATSLMNMLRTLFGISEDADAQAPGGGLTQGGVVRMQFSVDPRTNSIIVAGSADDLAVVEAILLRLDEGDVRERMTTVYRLKNAFAQDVALALNEWLQTERAAEAEAAVTISPFEQIEREVIIVPEPASNSLLVSATPRFYRDIRELIEQLDERPPMVIIQVLIAEVRLNDTDEFGIELGLQDSLLFDRSLVDPTNFLTITQTTQDQGPGGAVLTTTQQQIVNQQGQPGFNFNNQPLGNNLSSVALATASQVAAQGLSSFGVNRINNDLGFGGFVFAASSNSVNILLRALQESRRLEILSRPQLMALDGQPGQIQVGQNVPRILATAVDPLAGTVNTITYEPVGLILQVLPRISPDGLVVMQITANKSEVGPEAEGIPISISPTGQVLRAPRIEITQALTTVSALSGQTVVLGGLLQTRKFDVHRRVPLIADIPLIGDLFRYDSVAEERRELLIILTPRIIYGKQDADLVKQIESSRMSWILSDVINLHGEVGVRSRCDEWQDADIESVFPNLVPEEGLLPLSEPRFAPVDGHVLDVPACEPLIVPLPEMPAGELPLTPPPPVAPSALEPQAASQPSGEAADRYGYVDTAARQDAPRAYYSAPLMLPEAE